MTGESFVLYFAGQPTEKLTHTAFRQGYAATGPDKVRRASRGMSEADGDRGRTSRLAR
jgi:hypothetical protein